MHFVKEDSLHCRTSRQAQGVAVRVETTAQVWCSALHAVIASSSTDPSRRVTLAHASLDGACGSDDKSHTEFHGTGLIVYGRQQQSNDANPARSVDVKRTHQSCGLLILLQTRLQLQTVFNRHRVPHGIVGSLHRTCKQT
ncbi:hypothetical protein Ae201684P_014284 [Aphanomyces euteiches]|nr:hypothetical protein Ae201684P_014284 [Aphanomyces euteiches]